MLQCAIIAIYLTQEVFFANALDAPSAAKTLDLVTFKEGDKTNFKWTDLNDPVMGGRSTSTFKVEGGKGMFDGVCRIVPQLKAPGFCNAEARPSFGQKVPDASAFIEGGLEIELVSTGNLTQFKASFGNTAEHDFGSYKADFVVTAGSNTVRIPFTSFSNKWSSSTGEPTVKCTPEDKRVCPTAHSLATIGAIGVWAEGYAGQFHLEITAIRAYLGPSPGPGPAGCTGASVNLAVDQCAAWGEFWDGAGGPNWAGKGQNCSKSDPCGCRYAVGCGPKMASSNCSLSDSCDSSITTISLFSSNLRGTISNAVGAFVDMESFSVAGLTGSLPASMSAWKKVKYFSVRDNNFNTALPVLNYRAMRQCVLCGVGDPQERCGTGSSHNIFSCPFPQGVTDRCQKFDGEMSYEPITNADCHNTTASE